MYVKITVLFLIVLLPTSFCRAQKTAQERVDSLAKVGFITDMPQPQAFCVDGLIIGKALFDSLHIETKEITKQTGFRPQDAVKLFGQRGVDGVLSIETLKVYVVNGIALVMAEREGRLLEIHEDQIVSIRRVDPQELKRDYGVKNRNGGVVILTK